jgi:hypothetical protein
VEDIAGARHLVTPDENDAPHSIEIALVGYPSDEAIVAFRYRRFWSPNSENKLFRLMRGKMSIDRDTGYLLQTLANPPEYGDSHYDVFAGLFGAYRYYARYLPATDEGRWRTMFLADIVNEYWRREEHVLRERLTRPLAP